MFLYGIKLFAQTQVGQNDSPIFYKDGNVGIGNNIPSYTLDINGALRIGVGQIQGSLLLYSGSYQRYVSLCANNSYTENINTLGLRLSPKRILDLNTHYISDYSKTNTILSASRSDGTFYSELLQHKVYNGTNKHDLYFLNNGNVGIGTSCPSNKLEVNGAIRAKEVKVEASNWPDYIFESDYQLKDLAEVKEYITINKHLPDVPSAAEIEKNGVNLAEMNKLLLQKIEEMTLYLLIQQDKIDKQGEDIQYKNMNLEKLHVELKSLGRRIENMENNFEQKAKCHQ
jgi:hypothetical protein